MEKIRLTIKKNTFKYSSNISVQTLVLNDSPGEKLLCDSPDKIRIAWDRLIAPSINFHPTVENFIVFHINTRRRLIFSEVISTGTLDTILIHPREVFRSAIVHNSAAIIVAHNHPSGDPSPSEADIRVTKDLITVGRILKIEVLDHLIIGEKTESNRGYSSLRELGYFCA